ncbi:MAG TPA: efflux RND transporter periplasmic adaptor subunit [Rhodanobacteraceae bacterium]|nr:efflux RND transporter periplasmic adaptor subunit [Rhodanobacteraceae bacterium]
MNRTVVKSLLTTLALLILLTAAGVVGYVIARQSNANAPAAARDESSQREVLYWYDPMKPQQHFDHPGLSPMGMQMVPKYASENGTAKNIVRIDPAEVQNLGMRTAVVKVGRLSDTVHVPGSVAWDQRLAVTVSARTNATIEKLHVRAPYTMVEAGQPLAEILAPQWSAAVAEYFALKDARSATGQALRAAALERLHALGMDKATIRGLHAGSDTITLRAPVDGVVGRLEVQAGQQVGKGEPIMRINGLDKVWIQAAIPQAQVAGISAGAPITATVSALPNVVFHGKVATVLPTVDAATRTQQARIVLDNPGHRLAPGMFVDLRIAGTPSAPYPLVPTAAIIADGVHTRVIEALGDGRYRPLRVRTGRSSDGMTAIVAGLHGGERIVTSGQFLIDSEASLSGALQRLKAGHETTSGEAESSPEAPHPAEEGSNDMSGMSMNMPMPATSTSSGNGDEP